MLNQDIQHIGFHLNCRLCSHSHLTCN